MKIFVYGSLREGLYNFNKYINKSAVKIELAEVSGQLYAIKDKEYPALLECENSIAKGEIITLKNCDIDAIDQMENYFGEGHLENEYNKILKEVKNLENNKIELLPVYIYNRSNPNFNHDNLIPVASGDWKNR